MECFQLRVFIDGKDEIGWHLDVERQNITNSLKRLGLREESFLGRANIVHNISWNTILDPRKFFLRLKKNILVTTSNYIDVEDERFFLRKEFEKVKKIAKAWIAPSIRQRRILESYKLRTYYQPFYLDLSLFMPLTPGICKEMLLERFSVPREKVQNKIIIGSFQRDSLGNDLSEPKWQKGPDLLVEILNDMPKDRFLLLLAGPRRHYLREECRKTGISYHYVGIENDRDDIEVNSLEIQAMPYLYQLVDIYLVTSRSEGGPKAVMEATATKTYIFCTDVGLAADFIKPANVFQSVHEYKKRLFHFLNNYERIVEKVALDIEEQYDTCLNLLNYDAMDRRLNSIYTDVFRQ
jgi:hypothetical protein